MSYWWDTDFGQASQELYNQPALAVDAATVPDFLKTQTEKQYQQNQQAAQEETGGFMGMLGKVINKVDTAMSNVPGWGVTKDVVYTPLDMTGKALYKVYSEVVSQPISTLMIQAGKSEINGMGDLFSSEEWSDAYHHAEHQSIGQSFLNYEALNEFTRVHDAQKNANSFTRALDALSGGAGTDYFFSKFKVSDQDVADMKANPEKYLYATDFWRNAGGWKYDVGSGAVDFLFNVIDPVSGNLISQPIKAIKAARSVQLVARPAELAAEAGAPRLARTRGTVVDLFVKQQEPAQIVTSKQLQKTFDWMKADGRTIEEIRNHPIWGRGRRVNPARNDLSRLIAETPRNKMETLFRYSMEDPAAMREILNEAPEVGKKIGILTDNRTLLEGADVDPSFMAYHLAAQEGATIPLDPRLLVEPPTPRPITPGPRQAGWDARWGGLAQKAEAHRQVAAKLAADKVVSIVDNTPLPLNRKGMLKADQWMKGRIQTLNDDLNEAMLNQRYLNNVLGDIEGWSPTNAPIFGTLNKLYRAGGLGLRDTELAAEKATQKAATRRVRNIGSNMAIASIKNGLGGVINFVHAFGDTAPQGFIDHHDNDAADRVMDMLKRVDGMSAGQRSDLLEVYNKAQGKIERSAALKKVHDAVLNHILIANGNLDGELANALSGAIKDGIAARLGELTKGAGTRHQAFGPQAVGPEEVSALTGQPMDTLEEGVTRRADRVHAQEDGVGYVVSPLAQTQLRSNEILLPIEEIQRVIKATSGHLQNARAGGQAVRTVVTSWMDSADALWKFGTLLRPGFIPRMVSDEVLARMFKFGAMATLLDTTQGIGHFFSNRGRQLWAVMGQGSYTPATGKGIASRRTIINLDKQSAIGMKAANRGDKIKRIKVPDTLHMVHKQILKERQGIDDTLKELRSEMKKQAKGKDNQDYIDALHERLAHHDEIVDEYTEYMAEILRHAEDSVGRRIGEGAYSFTVGGTTYRVAQAFNREWDNPIPRDQLSSHTANKAIWGRGQAVERERFLAHTMKTGGYTFVHPGEVNHMESWLNAVNLQMGQDDFHKMIAGGMDDEQALNWLRKNPHGQKYMMEMGVHNQDPKQFVRSVRFMMDKYLGDDILRQKLARGEQITEQDLRYAFSEEEFPIVHGEEIKELSAVRRRETAAHYLEKFNEAAWRAVADLPTDIMSRHPVYLQFHQQEMENLISRQHYHQVANNKMTQITPKQWEDMNALADKKARAQLRQVVYDPKMTNGAQALRFIYPFFRPYVDGLDRWAGLIAERPEQLTKVGKVYNAPVAANLVTDDQGNHVDQNGMATVTEVGPDGKEHKVKKFVPLKGRVLHLKMPWAKKSVGDYPIRMQSLNTILPGDPWWDPGTGPIVQVGGNVLAKQSPQASEFLQWAKILPYGESQDIKDTLLPKYLKSAWDAYNAGDVDNVAYQKAFTEVYSMTQAQYAEDLKKGKHVKEPTLKDVETKTKHFLYFKALTDWTSPASVKTSPLNGTKYQFFADQYKALQNANPLTASDEFLKRYGEDFMGFTASLTKSIGISPTIAADAQMEKYSSEISDDPDMAPAIIGSMYNGGEFSDAVYNKQFRTELGGKMVRERLTAQEAIRDTRVREGWRDYMKTIQALDAMLSQNHFTSYQQAGAEQFAEAKRNITANLMRSNPAWAEEFGKTDRNKIVNRISSFTKMVNDPKIMNDPMRQDMQAMAVYLYRRQQFKAALQQQGLQQLSFDVSGKPTGQAAQLGYAWRQFQGQMISQSVSFSYLFNRYLNSDDLQ